MERDGAQQKGKNMLEYFHEKVQLCSTLELSFQETKIHVLESLYSKEQCTFECTFIM